MQSSTNSGASNVESLLLERNIKMARPRLKTMDDRLPMTVPFNHLPGAKQKVGRPQMGHEQVMRNKFKGKLKLHERG